VVVVGVLADQVDAPRREGHHSLRGGHAITSRVGSAA
jgi:hypothetical protein